MCSDPSAPRHDLSVMLALLLAALSAASGAALLKPIFDELHRAVVCPRAAVQEVCLHPMQVIDS